MRRSTAMSDHALQPAEYEAQIDELVEAISKEKGWILKPTDSAEPRLEKLLQFLLLVADKNIIREKEAVDKVKAVPLDSMVAKPSLGGLITEVGGKPESIVVKEDAK